MKFPSKKKKMHVESQGLMVYDEDPMGFAYVRYNSDERHRLIKKKEGKIEHLQERRSEKFVRSTSMTLDSLPSLPLGGVKITYQDRSRSTSILPAKCRLVYDALMHLAAAHERLAVDIKILDPRFRNTELHKMGGVLPSEVGVVIMKKRDDYSKVLEKALLMHARASDPEGVNRGLQLARETNVDVSICAQAFLKYMSREIHFTTEADPWNVDIFTSFCDVPGLLECENVGHDVLSRICKQGRRDLIDILLAHGVSMTQSDATKPSALCNAVTKGRLDLVQLLLSHNADVCAVNPFDDKPVLLTAISKGHTDVAKELLSTYVSLLLKTGQFFEPEKTGMNGNANGHTQEDRHEDGHDASATAAAPLPESVPSIANNESLLLTPTPKSKGHIHTAFSDARAAFVHIHSNLSNLKIKFPKSTGSEVTEDGEHTIRNTMDLVSLNSPFGTSLLYEAARRDNLHLMHLLIESRAQVNSVRGECGCRCTPLHGACGRSPEDGFAVAQWLLSGAKTGNNTTHVDVNAQCGKIHSYRTPLYMATRRNNVALAALLISMGAQVNMKCGSLSALHAAEEIGLVEMRDLLLASGAVAAETWHHPFKKMGSILRHDREKEVKADKERDDLNGDG